MTGIYGTSDNKSVTLVPREKYLNGTAIVSFKK